MLLKAKEAKVEWNAEKKQWHVVIQVGAEVIKRWVGDSQSTEDDALKTLAVQTARDEGYELDPAVVSVVK